MKSGVLMTLHDSRYIYVWVNSDNDQVFVPCANFSQHTIYTTFAQLNGRVIASAHEHVLI